jgi:dTDP-4-dehydrorhamnose 3,5-epimerase-like enzyme
MLYFPEGCGHGCMTLEDDTEVFHQMSKFYHPELARERDGMIRHFKLRVQASWK